MDHIPADTTSFLPDNAMRFMAEDFLLISHVHGNPC